MPHRKAHPHHKSAKVCHPSFPPHSLTPERGADGRQRRARLRGGLEGREERPRRAARPLHVREMVPEVEAAPLGGPGRSLTCADEGWGGGGGRCASGATAARRWQQQQQQPRLRGGRPGRSRRRRRRMQRACAPPPGCRLRLPRWPGTRSQGPRSRPRGGRPAARRTMGGEPLAWMTTGGRRRTSAPWAHSAPALPPLLKGTCITPLPPARHLQQRVGREEAAARVGDRSRECSRVCQQRLERRRDGGTPELGQAPLRSLQCGRRDSPVGDDAGRRGEGGVDGAARLQRG